MDTTTSEETSESPFGENFNAIDGPAPDEAEATNPDIDLDALIAEPTLDDEDEDNSEEGDDGEDYADEVSSTDERDFDEPEPQAETTAEIRKREELDQIERNQQRLELRRAGYSSQEVNDLGF